MPVRVEQAVFFGTVLGSFSFQAIGKTNVFRHQRSNTFLRPVPKNSRSNRIVTDSMRLNEFAHRNKTLLNG